MKEGLFTKITGPLAILADITGLIGFASGFLKPNYNSFFLHPALWLVIQLAIVIYGNIMIAYSYMLRINKVYISQKNYSPNDIENTLNLFVYLTWIPTFLIWLVSFFILVKIIDFFIFFICVAGLFVIVFGGLVIASCGSLLSRTLRPELPIKIKIDFPS